MQIRAASTHREANGPAMYWPKSTTLIPASGGDSCRDVISPHSVGVSPSAGALAISLQRLALDLLGAEQTLARTFQKFFLAFWGGQPRSYLNPPLPNAKARFLTFLRCVSSGCHLYFRLYARVKMVILHESTRFHPASSGSLFADLQLEE